MTNESDAENALNEAARLRRDVTTQSSRWHSRYLVLLGVAMLAMYCLYAIPSPAQWAIVLSWVGIALVVFWRYERTEHVRTQDSLRRLHTALISYFILTVALVAVGALLFTNEPAWWWPSTAVVVSLPFFVAAYLERRDGEHDSRAGTQEPTP